MRITRSDASASGGLLGGEPVPSGATNLPEPTSGPGSHGNALRYKREYWASENLKFRVPHHRMVKVAQLVKSIARQDHRTLLDVGCGPATLRRLLPSTIDYHGIDIAIQDPAPNLVEVDILENPIAFGGLQFDIVVAQGVFEYMGGAQDRKLSEIAELLKEGGTFLASYTNFAHRRANVYSSFSNVQPIEAFREDLRRHFRVDRVFPASHNWNHSQPTRPVIRALNMLVNTSVPGVSPFLAVEYFFVCSPQ